MTRTVKTGLQFLATSTGFTITSALFLYSQERVPTDPFIPQVAEWRLMSGGLCGLLAFGTGLVAFSYLVSGGIEAIGRGINRKE